MINADFAELVDHDRQAPAVIRGQQAIDQRSFAGTEKSSDDYDRRFFGAVRGNKWRVSFGIHLDDRYGRAVPFI
jgi:hypothetical protein